MEAKKRKSVFEGHSDLLAVFAVTLIFGKCCLAVRVYEGTKSQGAANFTIPETRNEKAYPTISKRSWEPTESDKYEKWREVDRRSTTVENDRVLRVSNLARPMPNLYKVRLTQHGYIQFLKYLAKVPPMQEYTFCVWFMSNNLTHLHSLFSYSMDEKERLIGFWLNPSESSFQMGIRDEIVFKVPVTIRLHRWYHVCQSWSGLNGEWAVFLDGKKKGSGALPKYQGTYIPGGGDVGVGQELTDVDKGLDDGVEGEIFGFNLVDEAVDFTSKRHQPHSPVPPFKSLPPSKKTFEDIQSYIANLPARPSQQNQVQTLTDIAEEDNAIKTEEPVRYAKKTPKKRYPPPVRKVVVYNRQDRQLKNDEFGNTVPTKRTVKEKQKQLYDENYSIHSYKASKEAPKSKRYEIYEVVEDEGNLLRSRQDVDVQIERKPRVNFDLIRAREANRLYPFSGRSTDTDRLAYHFQMTEPKKTAERRSLELDTAVPAAPAQRNSRLTEVIPVHEDSDGNLRYPSRKKRHIQTGAAEKELLEEGFKPLPDIPSHLLDIFKPDVTNDQLKEKLSKIFSADLTEMNATQDDPLSRRQPQNFPDSHRFKLASVFPPAERTFFSFNNRYAEDGIRRRLSVTPRPQFTVEKGSFKPTTGTELVLRSYMSCGLDRGSPVTDKNHLVVSWSDTPVRLYGGAMIANANNACGRF